MGSRWTKFNKVFIVYNTGNTIFNETGTIVIY